MLYCSNCCAYRPATLFQPPPVTFIPSDVRLRVNPKPLSTQFSQTCPADVNIRVRQISPLRVSILQPSPTRSSVTGRHAQDQRGRHGGGAGGRGLCVALRMLRPPHMAQTSRIPLRRDAGVDLATLSCEDSLRQAALVAGDWKSAGAGGDAIDSMFVPLGNAAGHNLVAALRCPAWEVLSTCTGCCCCWDV
jgi:hypothetical protein